MRRRRFLRLSAAGSAGFALSAASYGRVWGAHSEVRLAVIGLRGRGRDHLGGFGERVVAVCDCDRKILAATQPDRSWQRFVDYRELLAKAEIDAVSIATPNHTHSLIGIDALRAGKHVYVEKPISHNVWEGRQLVHAARASQRVVQCGTQSRSSPSLQEAREFLHSGAMGAIRYAVGTCYKPRMSIGKLDQPLQIPEHIDFDLWCGPALKQPLYRPQLHYDWHWDFNTGNGDMGNQGIHQMDLARWFLGERGLSRRVLSVGGRLGYEDAGNTPNSQTVLHQFEKTFLIFETRGLPRSRQFHGPDDWPRNMDQFRGSSIGVVVQCEGGHLLIPSYSSAIAFDAQGAELRRWSGDGNHYANFLEAVEENDSARLNAEVEEGHLSSALCHTGAVSHRLGRPATPRDILTSFRGVPPEFSESVERLFAHLADNGIDLDQPPGLTLGADLQMDPATERFVDNAAADALLTREYREPFTLAAG